MNKRGVGILVSLSILLALPCWSAPNTMLVEPFDGTIDQASWRAGAADQIVSTGGHPDGYLRIPGNDLAVPRISVVPSLGPGFLGNYRNMGVTGLGIDVDIFDVSISVDGRPVSLILSNDGGTPDDFSDDCEIASVSTKNLPRPGAGWRAFDFKVPANNSTMPPGWIVTSCGTLTRDQAWMRVMGAVSSASFDFGEPGFFYFFQIWTIGYDNPRLSFR